MANIRPHVVLIMEGGVIHQVFGFNTNLNVIVIDHDGDDPEDVAYCAEEDANIYPEQVIPMSLMNDELYANAIKHLSQLEVGDAETERDLPAEAPLGGDRPAAGPDAAGLRG